MEDGWKDFTNKWTYIHTDKLMDRQRDGQMNRQMEERRDGQTDRQKDRHMDGQRFFNF